MCWYVGKDNRNITVMAYWDHAGATSAAVSGIAAKAAMGETLTAPKVDSVNSFDAPNAVAPKPAMVKLQGNQLSLTLAPKSITVISIQE